MNNGRTNSPLEVYKTYKESVLAGGEQWKQLVSEDILFYTPLVNLKGKKSFINFHINRYKTLLKRVVENIAVCDNYVIVASTYLYRKPTQETFTIQATEWFTINDGQIEAIESFGDASVLQDKPINIYSYLQKPSNK